jgi:hypothetical protein
VDTSFRPREPYRSKAQIVTVSASLGTLTANDTTTIHIPVPARRGFILSASVHQGTVAADADGTILATLKRYDASATSLVALTSAFNLEGQTARSADRLTMLGGTTRYKAREDTLVLEVVSNSAAINTQPADAFVVVELALLD